ncbi:hypothetical protein [Cohnella sp. GCM10027633]|uniref:hypothetical protein n=1 Tax=unclassified Cohnella TaxID=2636738 RepID=UPI00362E9CC9
MENMTILTVWLIGLFGILGIVLAALTKMVKTDTTTYDKQFTWKTYPHWEQYARAAERTESVRPGAEKMD